MARVVISPTPVQGEEAPALIIAALDGLEREVNPDVILLARGGGSIEDLWAFNDERLVRAIAACSVPVICGVGHETDFTLADFAADLRAPTPTAAAELAAADREELHGALQDLSRSLSHMIRSHLQAPRWQLDELHLRLQMLSPRARIRSDRQQLDDLARRGISALSTTMLLKRTRLSSLEQRLGALNPEAVLRRGFAVVTRQDGELIRSVDQVQAGDPLQVQVRDGQFGVKVDERETR